MATTRLLLDSRKTKEDKQALLKIAIIRYKITTNLATNQLSCRICFQSICSIVGCWNFKFGDIFLYIVIIY